MTASARPGMGAVPYSAGVTFRVWAPFASAVAVTGHFNDWSTDGAPLSLEQNGYWSRDVEGAAIGDQYKFIIAPASGEPLWKNDPYARSMTNSVGNSIVAETEFAWTCQDYASPSWNELVIYELHVGSFAFDPGSENGRGDFDTVIGKLDYLGDLGINAIQLMPSDEFAGDVSWGYNPAQIFAIEASYGGPNGLRRLIDAAHSRGIAVIYDVVYNHFGPSDLDLWQFDGWSQDNRGGIYFYNDWRRQTPWGDTRPDYGRGEVRQYIRDNALYWLQEHQCDGLRWDATGWIRNVWGSGSDTAADLPDGWNLLRWINSEIRARQPWKISIAEDMQDNGWITAHLDDGGAGFGAQWGAGFMHAVRDAIVTGDDAARDMNALSDVLQQRFNGNTFERVLYTESHDEVAASAGQARVPELIWPGNAGSFYSQKRSTLGAALVLTAPGIPMLFMGQEFLESGAWTDAQALDWSKLETFAGIYALYRDLIRLRRNWFDTTRGLKGQNVRVHHVNQTDKVLAFHRWDQGGARDDVIVLVNFANRIYSGYRIGLPRAGQWRVRFNGDWEGYSPDFTNAASFDVWTSDDGADGMAFSAEIGIGPYAAVILSQDA
ncbi:MAG TPA: alpha-amylase family glycosyl hydrolase [Micropepsaceae bacterium]|jgi:1,4-alpha-glucan branching enzyme|nr:alpha-amylase family glycosyl hydrolase [Micropepsaceae bacterium]